MYTDKKGFPHVDYKQDYFLENAETGGQELILEYWRKFDTCDSHDYLLDVSAFVVVCIDSMRNLSNYLTLLCHDMLQKIISLQQCSKNFYFSLSLSQVRT